MKGRVDILSSTVGEFDLCLTVWLINEDDPSDHICDLYEVIDSGGHFCNPTRALKEAEDWCRANGYEVVGRPWDDT